MKEKKQDAIPLIEEAIGRTESGNISGEEYHGIGKSPSPKPNWYKKIKITGRA